MAILAEGRSQDVITMYEAMNQNVVPPAEEIISGAETPQTVLNKLRLNKGGSCMREKYLLKKPVAN